MLIEYRIFRAKSRLHAKIIPLGVHRDFYAQERGMPASSRFHIYGSICDSKSDLRVRATTNFGRAANRATRDCLRRAPSPLEGRFPTHPLTTYNSQLVGPAFAGCAAPHPALRASAARQVTNATFVAHEYARMKSQCPLLYNCLGV